MVCACCQQAECETDEDCPILCAPGEHLVYDGGGQPYCCPIGRDYIGSQGGTCLLVPEGTPGDQDFVIASDIIVQYCCDGTCQTEPCGEPLSLPQGPGTELTKIIAWIGLTPAPGCKCKKRARYMDKMGCDWCEQNMSQIIGWLQEEHTRTKSLLPFISFAAEKLVRLAIRRARKGNSQ
jgi:hypothetical protein